MRYIVGIDEAGRGPLAGPVAVGAVKVREKYNKNQFRGVRDSKKLSPRERERWFGMAHSARKKGEIDFAVSLVSERVIDKKGIVYAINLGIKRCLEKLSVQENSKIFLDGGIRAPDSYPHQETVVKGDEKIPVISLASILAKVTRDRKMIRIAKKYPQYCFDIHKGYGTKRHCQVIRKYGLTEVHRRTFTKRLTK